MFYLFSPYYSEVKALKCTTEHKEREAKKIIMNDSLFCPIRKIWVAALPEEKVRQALIQRMIHHLGYPCGTLALEKSLDQLPHLQSQRSLPKRRADLIVFAKGIHPQHPLYPLLLIECKAVPIANKTLRQLIGYNQFIGAPFIAAVNQTQTSFGWYQQEKNDFVFKEGFFPYDLLLNLARQHDIARDSTFHV